MLRGARRLASTALGGRARRLCTWPGSPDAVTSVLPPMDAEKDGLSRPVVEKGPLGTRFNNPWSTWREWGIRDAAIIAATLREFVKEGGSGGWLLEEKKPTAADFRQTFPLTPVDWSTVTACPKDAVQALWVGHATALVQIGDVRFITDPVFSDRCSPTQWMGPKRVVPPAVDLDDPQFPKLDFVVISHNHYDHLDRNSVAGLHRKFGDDLAWYVPMGLASWFRSRGVSNVTELTWWEGLPHGDSGVSLRFLPTQHWSARSLTDRRSTLWGSWLVTGPAGRVYFGGDTAYCPAFKQIGQEHAPIDLALIPVGAYLPREFMRPQHVDPEEAVKIHQDIGARFSMGIHCCTFALTTEALDQPPRDLEAAVSAAGLSPDAFVVLRHGEHIRVAGGRVTNTPKLLPVSEQAEDG